MSEKNFNRASVFKLLKKVINENLGTDEELIQENNLLVDDLGCDSLDIVEIVMALEEELCEIEIPDETIEGFSRVSDIIDYIMKHGKGFIQPKSITG